MHLLAGIFQTNQEIKKYNLSDKKIAWLRQFAKD
jgi:hypothetical protein